MRDEINERAAAEDYRRQRQDADASKIGFIPMRQDKRQQWLIENEALISQIAKANGTSDQDLPTLSKSTCTLLWRHLQAPL